MNPVRRIYITPKPGFFERHGDLLGFILFYGFVGGVTWFLGWVVFQLLQWVLKVSLMGG